ncbi:GSCOCG00000329001-RA-CDS, partial [Cotesia congregata]
VFALPAATEDRFFSYVFNVNSVYHFSYILLYFMIDACLNFVTFLASGHQD